jgi:Ig-like domain CHU_C associated/EF hand
MIVLPHRHPLVRRIFNRLSSLLMLFQRAPLVQMFFPEAKLLSTTGFSEALTLGITTVIGLGAYDTVSGASTVTQVTPTANSSTVSATSGSALSFVFKYGGSDTPDHFQVVGTLPTGLTQTKTSGSKTDSITGKPTVTGSYPITIRAWRFASQTGDNVSATFTIVVAAGAPTISSQPASVSIESGTSTTLSVTASGTSITYQWYQGTSGITTNPISGATSSTYTTPTLTAETNYWVKITDSNSNSVSSNTAAVTVYTPPVIVTQPQGATINTGNTTNLGVSATGAGLTYQWYQGNSGTTTSPVSGATSASFTTPTLTATTNYWVRVTNSGGHSKDSDTATVTVNQPPAVSAQPAAITIASGSSTTLSVTASGSRLTYQWYLGTTGDISQPIAGATSSSYTTDTLTADTSYWVRITDSNGLIRDSDTVTVTTYVDPDLTGPVDPTQSTDAWCFVQLDANNDGWLSLEEWKNIYIKAPAKEKPFAGLDTSGNGKLSFAEFLVGKTKKNKAIVQYLTRGAAFLELDTDEDDTISASELDLMFLPGKTASTRSKFGTYTFSQWQKAATLPSFTTWASAKTLRATRAAFVVTLDTNTDKLITIDEFARMYKAGTASAKIQAGWMTLTETAKGGTPPTSLTYSGFIEGVPPALKLYW